MMGFLFFSKLGRILLSIVAIGAVWFGWLLHHDSKVRSGVITKIEQRNAKNVEKANAARRAVESIPADKLDDRYRRD